MLTGTTPPAEGASDRWNVWPGDASGRFELSTLDAIHAQRRGANRSASTGASRLFPTPARSFPIAGQRFAIVLIADPSRSATRPLIFRIPVS
jgi:hypothetical protein